LSKTEKPEDRRPLTPEEVKTQEALLSMKDKARSAIEDAKEIMLKLMGMQASDVMTLTTTVINQGHEIVRLTELLDKHKIPHKPKPMNRATRRKIEKDLKKIQKKTTK
jgi:uncharacterized protein YbcI